MTSKDGYVRTVKVKTCSTVSTRAKNRRKEHYKTSNTILTRPVAKLCLLEMDAWKKMHVELNSELVYCWHCFRYVYDGSIKCCKWVAVGQFPFRGRCSYRIVFPALRMRYAGRRIRRPCWICVKIKPALAVEPNGSKRTLYDRLNKLLKNPTVVRPLNWKELERYLRQEIWSQNSGVLRESPGPHVKIARGHLQNINKIPGVNCKKWAETS